MDDDNDFNDFGIEQADEDDFVQKAGKKKQKVNKQQQQAPQQDDTFD